MRGRERLIAGALSVLVLLAGCAPAQPEGQPAGSQPQEASEKTAPYHFGIGYSSTGYTEKMELWRELVLEATDGNVELMLFGENVLGEGAEMAKAVQRGKLSIVASSTSVCTNIVPQAAIMDIPACFTQYTRPFQIYDGVFFDALNACYNQQGLELLYLRTGEPWIISSASPVRTLDELDGMRVRTSGSNYHNKLYDALGIQRVENVGLSGLAYILQENGVDGIEATYTILKTQGLLEVQPYALGSLFVMSSAVVMNYDAFHGLPQDYQDILKSCLKQALGQQQEDLMEQTQGDAQMTIFQLSPEDEEKLRKLAQPLLDEILACVDDQLLQALTLENESHSHPDR